MNLSELITLYREQSFDKAEPYFCSDDLLTIYANEAQAEACRRGELLRDSSSTLCTIAFVADAESVALDSRVVRVIQAKSGGSPLSVVNLDMMDSISPDWQENASRGKPSHLVEGLTSGRLFLWPRPAVDGSIKLTVQRLPLDPLANDGDEPEIRSELHFGLVEWMLFKAYSREETEMYNDTKAALSLGRFVAEFGRKASGRNEAWQRHGSSINAAPIA